MIEWICSAWCDFWHVMYLLRGGFIVLAMIATPPIAFFIFIVSLGKDGWR